MSLLERVYSLHLDLLQNRYPNAATLVDRFEISIATARRDIAYLRDRLMAPLAFDHRRNGFYYTESDFSLPFAESPRLTLLLAMLSRFAREAGLRGLPEVVQLEQKLSSMLSDDSSRLLRSLYCEWIEVESIDTGIFAAIIEAVVKQRTLTIDYTGNGAECTSRCIEPQRLCNYQGRWYLLAHCRLRRDLRMFHIARIRRAEPGKEKFAFLPDLEERYLLSSFGIFKGESPETAEILFTGTAAELVGRQHWHREQQLEVLEEGVLLRLPVSDDREIAMKVLQYGSQARVIGPESLQRRVALEIKTMAALYA